MPISRLHMLGLILWRGGLLLAGGYALYLAVDYALDLLAAMGGHISPVPKAGFALVIAGVLFVLLSLILERIHDARQEHGEEV